MSEIPLAELVVQTANYEHIPGIQRLALSCHITNQTDAEESFIVELLSDDWLSTILEDGLSRVILDGAEVIGHLLVCSEPQFTQAYGKSLAEFIGLFGVMRAEPCSAFAEQVCIHKTWRRKGLYRKLLADTESAACARGITGFYGDIFGVNTISLMVHEKMGWRRQGVITQEDGTSRYLVYEEIGNHS